MHQTKYALSILHQFNMDHCAPSYTPLLKGMFLPKDTATPYVDATIYRMLISKFLFLINTKPDLTHDVNVVTIFMQNPHEMHLQAAKHTSYATCDIIQSRTCSLHKERKTICTAIPILTMAKT